MTQVGDKEIASGSAKASGNVKASSRAKASTNAKASGSAKPPGNAKAPGNVKASSNAKPVAPRRSWWWGVIPAVAAVCILTFWLTGQFEEIFGIDPRGTWVAESGTEEKIVEPLYGEPVPLERKIRWELVIDNAEGELWINVSRNGEEILGGPLSVVGDSLSHLSPRGSFNGVYYTSAKQFRYNPFARRYIQASIRLGPGNAYSLLFERK